MKQTVIYLLPVILTLLSSLSCGSDKHYFDATGAFEATEIIVSAQATGVILAFDAQEGEVLQEGESIAVIDTVQLFLQRMSLLSNVRGIRAQSPDIKIQTAAVREQIKTLEREKLRTERLIAENVGNRKQLDDIESQMEVLQGQLLALTSSLQKNSAQISAQSSAAEIQIAQLEDQLSKCRILAPISGTLIEKYVQKGELAIIGAPLFKMANLNEIFLRAYVTTDQMTNVRLNDKVTVLSDNGEGGVKSYDGRICWIADKAEFTPKTIQTRNERANLVYALKIAVNNDGFLKIGMYGEVIFNHD